MSRRVALARVLVIALACSGLGVAAGCAGGAQNAQSGLPVDPILDRQADDFYERIANRRFDSIATYRDPALREYFRSNEAWSDYYADLVQTLTDQYFEAKRPTHIKLVGIEPQSETRALVRVRFTGENRLPLRWWRTRFVREDTWERVQDRWWIVPGKL